MAIFCPIDGVCLRVGWMWLFEVNEPFVMWLIYSGMWRSCGIIGASGLASGNPDVYDWDAFCRT